MSAGLLDRSAGSKSLELRDQRRKASEMDAVEGLLEKLDLTDRQAVWMLES